MIFSYNWLQSFFKEKLPKPEKLAELLTMYSFETKEVKKIGEDFVLDLDVTPNRGPDCFSHIGIAREISVITNLKYTVPTWAIEEDEKLKTKDFVSVDVKNKNVCSRYTARVFTDLTTNSSPGWIQERLKACGLRPINSIVDITNYVMLETGQPLHAFDGEKIEGKKIIVRFAKKGEKLTTLDNKKYDLNKNILVIADIKKPIGIAGIKGGLTTGIGKRTKTVVLESANFDPRTIRQGSKALSLKTDASWRFEHGIAPDLTEFAINRAASLIQEITGAKIAKGLIDFYPKRPESKEIRLDLDYVEKLLGVKISKKEIVKILQSLEFEVESLGPKVLKVGVPTFRLDVSIPEDLIEEIGRITGYENIPAILPESVLIPPKRNENIFWEEKARDILKEAGLSEVYNYCFISEKVKNEFSFRAENLLEVKNPLSREYKYLRPSLLPNLLKNVRDNFRFFDKVKIFELGKVYKKSKIIEKRILAGIIARKKRSENGLSEIKGITDLILEKLGISDVWYDSFEPTPEEEGEFWNPKRCGEIKVGDREIGFFGEIRPLKDLKIEAQILGFEFDFEKLQKLATEELIYTPISPYPSAVRDLAVLVPRGVKVAEVLNEINLAGGELVIDVDLFDLYEGEKIPEGKKNLAFHIVYQAKDRTLTKKEIDKVHKKIIEALEKNLDWWVRRRVRR